MSLNDKLFTKEGCNKLDIATFEFTKEGYTDYSKSKVFPKKNDHQNPCPLPSKFLPI